ncbi:diguanylate cyclase [Pseudoxanthomonas sp.]|uniref:sensor domain-containing diguanylate cyclase n=1 Tax=Pseudoxanthomonas sp. TaxID=1871049 RepID=UPI002FE12256
MADTVPDAAPPPSLQRKFTTAVILAAVLPAVGLGLADQVAAYRSQAQYLRDRVEVTAALSGAAVDEFVQAKLSSVGLLADLGTVKVEGWGARLEELRERYPHFISALVTDGNGKVLAMSPEPPADTPSSGVTDREYFRVPQRSHRPFVSDAFVGRRLGNDALVAVSAPLMEDGKFMGVVEGSIPVSSFVSVRTSGIQRRGMEVLIVDRSRHVIHASDGIPYTFLQDVSDRVASVDPASGRRSTPAVFMTGVLRDGRGAWVSQARLEAGWTLIIFAPETELWSFLYRRALTSFGIMSLVLLGVWFAYRWQMRRFNAALRKLVESLGGLAADGRNTISRIASLPDEFQPLGRAIRDLSWRLESANADLQASLMEQRNLALSLQESLQRTESEVTARTAELRAAVEELDRLNQTDALTGCLNRRGLQKCLASWSDEHGELGGAVTVIAFDVDHFKAYNDRYGHAAGDAALRRLAGAVSGLLEDSLGCLVRSGGEEFLLIVPTASFPETMSLGGAVCEAVSRLSIPHQDSAYGVMTISVGLARGRVGEDLATILMAADDALYRAKHAGRNRVES